MLYKIILLSYSAVKNNITYVEIGSFFQEILSSLRIKF